MIEKIEQKIWRKIAMGALLFVTIGSLALRFYQITRSEFFFYDEGFYLNYNRLFLETIAERFPKTFRDWFMVFKFFIRFSLLSGKALYFMLSDSRVFFGRLDSWFFSRVVSAVAGALTLPMTFLFAKRFYKSLWAGLLAMAFLAVLPGHVFYSRLGMQEALATLFFLTGFYLYIFPSGFGKRTFFAGIAFAAAYFCNYRLIVLPVLMAFSEGFLSFAEHRKPDFRKWLWLSLTFCCLVFFIGNYYNGEHTVVTFAWMFYQAHLAKQQTLELFNFLSYPYYIFRLESILLGLLFFGNFYYYIRRQWRRAFPFSFVIFQMFYFSFAMEKGARYVCVVFPFIAMAAASLIVYLWEEKPFKPVRVVLAVLTVLLSIQFVAKSVHVAQFQTDYKPAMEYMTKTDANVRVLSTQSYVQNLYVKDRTNVIDCPKQYRYMLYLYMKGFRYLVLDPQGYVYLTESEKRFDPPLKGFLNFIFRQVQPIKIYPHFNYAMLERFVFDHNQYLRISIDFLKSKDPTLGQLRIYDIRQCINAVNRALGLKTELKENIIEQAEENPSVIWERDAEQKQRILRAISPLDK